MKIQIDKLKKFLEFMLLMSQIIINCSILYVGWNLFQSKFFYQQYFINQKIELVKNIPKFGLRPYGNGHYQLYDLIQSNLNVSAIKMEFENNGNKWTINVDENRKILIEDIRKALDKIKILNIKGQNKCFVNISFTYFFGKNDRNLNQYIIIVNCSGGGGFDVENFYFDLHNINT